MVLLLGLWVAYRIRFACCGFGLLAGAEMETFSSILWSESATLFRQRGAYETRPRAVFTTVEQLVVVIV